MIIFLSHDNIVTNPWLQTSKFFSKIVTVKTVAKPQLNNFEKKKDVMGILQPLSRVKIKKIEN